MIIRRWVIRVLVEQPCDARTMDTDSNGDRYVRNEVKVLRTTPPRELAKFYASEEVAENAIARHGRKNIAYEVVKMVFRTDNPELFPEYFGEEIA